MPKPSRTMPIRGVGFDYLGVVAQLPGDNIFGVVGRMLDVEEERVQRIYQRHNRAMQVGDIDAIECWSRVVLELGQPNMVEAVVGVLGRDRPVPDAHVLDLVDRLRRAGYKLGLLSNLAAGEWTDDLYQAGVDQHFDVTLLSGETGLAKPDPRAFQMLAQRLGTDPLETVFIDDRPSSIVGIAALGLKPIVFTSVEECEDDLKELGLTLS